jgi:hypothetical protein
VDKETLFYFKNETLKLFDFKTYMDNSASYGTGMTHIWEIFIKLKDEKKVIIEKNGSKIELTEVSEYYDWLVQNGYELYSKKLALEIYKRQKSKIRNNK